MIYRITTCILLFALCFMCPAVFSENNIGVGISQSIDGEVSVGIQGEFETDAWDIEYTYQGIELHDAKVNIQYKHNFKHFAISVFQENDWTGYTLLNTNRTNDLGVSGIVPIGDVDIEFAVFGRQGNIAEPVTKYDENTGEPVKTTPGLTPVEGTQANVALSTALDIKGIELELKALTNVAEDPTPQWLIDASTTHKIGVFDWTLAAAYQGQRHLDELQHQVSTLLTFGLQF